MRTIFIWLLAIMLAAVNANAQIMVTPHIPDDVEGITDNTRNLLANKLGSILSGNGMITVDNPVRFVLVMRWDVLEKQVLPTAPTTVAYDLQVTFIMGDGMLGTKYSSCSIRAKGVGRNEEAAIRNAVSGIGNKADAICDMVEKGHKQIVDYYNKNINNLLTHAQGLIKQQMYDEAVYTLYQIPTECSGYNKAQDMIGKAFQAKIDKESAEALASAEATWASNPTSENADAVAEMLEGVNPLSSSAADAKKLVSSMKTRIQSIDDKMIAEASKAAAHERDMEKARVNAIKDVALAYASHQPAVTYNFRGWW